LLYCWGSNAEGQLGVTGSKGSSAPLLVGHSNRWKQLAVGDTHSCGLVTTSDVWCWGSNTYGQLGVDGTAARGEPARVVGDIVFAQVAAGGSDTCAIDTQGRLYCWGKSAATQAPRQVGTASDWVLVDVGSYAICAIRGAGELYCWGAGTEPTRVGTASNFSKVAVGVTHSCATNAVGMLYCWGKNDFGQLGIGNSTDASSPTQVGDLAYRSVAVGAKHSCAVTASGELRCWGSNSVGQLGLSSGPSTTGALKPTAPNLTDEFDLVFSGGNVTCALAVSGKLYCFGDNASGALGIGSSDSTTKTKAVCVADDTRTETPDGGTSSVVCPNAVHCEIAACEEESCGEQGEVCRDGACVCPSGATRLGFCRSWNIHETLLERRRQERRWPHEDPLGFPIRWIHHLR
jgi:alpha-tubulin suppressor-like RCC1 family protein